MLIPILGRAGSGKTTWILDKVEQTAKQGGRVLLIVPEQFSEMEKAVYACCEGKLAMQVEVYSFTRLCHHIFQQCGGDGRRGAAHRSCTPDIDEPGTGTGKDQLDLYLRPSRNTAFVSTMLRQVDEFKMLDTPQKLREFSKQTALPPAGKEDRRDVHHL